MPLPKPDKHEDKDDFISRCMSDDKMKKEFSDNKQRYAVCMKQFEKNEGEKMDIYEKYLLPSSPESINEIDEFMSDLMESVFNFIVTIDIEELNEDQYELLEEILDMYNGELNEKAPKRTRVVRDGKKVTKMQCPSGYKLVGKKCVKQSAAEKRTRSKASKRGAKKKKGQQTSISRKRKRSMKRT